jgi:preprotein translocase subunit SecG
MRRSRRGGHSGLEFGGSGEDSFVAVVVTKLTGALLFILLLTMVIMALLPKVAPDHAARDAATPGASAGGPLKIATPGTLPDAVAGRPYVVVLAATGGHGTPRWRVDGKLPAGLTLDEATGRIAGTPPRATDEPIAFGVSADDGSEVASQAIRLGVLPSLSPPNAGTWWKPRWPAMAVAWRSWMEQGVGFLVLWLVHLLGMNLLSSLERQSTDELALDGMAGTGQVALLRRFGTYRILVRLTTLSATIALAIWLVTARGPSL